MDVITKQQELMKQRSTVFDTLSISEGFFIGANRVNCAAPFCEYLHFCDVRAMVIDARGSILIRWGEKGGIWHR